MFENGDLVSASDQSIGLIFNILLIILIALFFKYLLKINKFKSQINNYMFAVCFLIFYKVKIDNIGWLLNSQ